MQSAPQRTAAPDGDTEQANTLANLAVLAFLLVARQQQRSKRPWPVWRLAVKVPRRFEF